MATGVSRLSVILYHTNIRDKLNRESLNIWQSSKHKIIYNNENATAGSFAK